MFYIEKYGMAVSCGPRLIDYKMLGQFKGSRLLGLILKKK